MQFFRRKKAPIRRLHIYLIALLFATIVTIQSATTNENGQIVLNITFIILFYINYIVWALIFDWVFGLFLSIKEFKKPVLKNLISVVINLLLLALAHSFISNIIFYIYRLIIGSKKFNEIVPQFLEYFSRIYSQRLLDIIIILGLLKILDLFRTSQSRKLKVAELENQLHMSQLQSLRAQLNPHFLFNSLHALHTLIGHNDEKAKNMVIKISNLLRRILDHSDKQLITLEEELEYLKDYLDIEQERFHDRLTIDFNIDSNSKKFMVPSLMLQTLAENAFKHGISLLVGKGIIKLSAKLNEDRLLISMSNTTPLENNGLRNNSTKVGLKNLRKRLIGIYGENQSIATIKNKTIFKVDIMLKSTRE